MQDKVDTTAFTVFYFNQKMNAFRRVILYLQGAMMSVAFKEGLKIPPPAMNEIILSANQDIRQVTIRILNLNILFVCWFMQYPL